MCAEISFLIKLNTVDLQLLLAQVYLVNFVKFGRTPFFPEHHRKAASDYNCINSSEARIGKRNFKL